MKTSRIQQRRQKILNTSLQVFADKGYFQTSISDIATKLKIGHGTFYRYFTNKKSIFEALLESILEHIGTELLKEPPAAASSLEDYAAQLQRIGHKLYKIFMNHPGYAQIVFYEAHTLDDSIQELLESGMESLQMLTATYLEHGVSSGYLRPTIDPSTCARAINAMLFEAIKQVLKAEEAAQEYERWEKTISNFIIHGLGEPKA